MQQEILPGVVPILSTNIGALQHDHYHYDQCTSCDDISEDGDILTTCLYLYDVDIKNGHKGAVSQTGAKIPARGAKFPHVGAKFPHVRAKFPHVGAKFPHVGGNSRTWGFWGSNSRILGGRNLEHSRNCDDDQKSTRRPKKNQNECFRALEPTQPQIVPNRIKVIQTIDLGQIIIQSC